MNNLSKSMTVILMVLAAFIWGRNYENKYGYHRTRYDEVFNLAKKASENKEKAQAGWRECLEELK